MGIKNQREFKKKISITPWWFSHKNRRKIPEYSLFSGQKP